MTRLDDPHDDRCPTAQGADPEYCRCDHPDLLGQAAPPPDRAASPAEQRRLQALFTNAGYSRAERLALIGDVIGRPVASSSELTEHQNRAVCARLKAEPPAADPGHPR